MNIFVTDPDPVKSAQSLPDKHIVKMPLESCQMLAIVASAQELSWPEGTGFTAGNPISYRYWDSSSDTEISGVFAEYNLGEITYSDVFSDQGSTYVILSGDSTMIDEEEEMFEEEPLVCDSGFVLTDLTTSLHHSEAFITGS